MSSTSYKGKRGIKNNKSQSSTIKYTPNHNKTFNATNSSDTNTTDQNILYNVICDVSELKKQIEQFQENLSNTNKEMKLLQKNEKKLLNRFGWTLIMANILLGVLVVIIIAISINLFYPYLKELEKSNSGMFWVITIMMELILVAIIGLLIKVERFALYIKDRDTKKYNQNKK